MDSVLLIKEIAVSDFVRDNLPVHLQLGIPLLKKKNGQLRLILLPHSETICGSELLIGSPDYVLELHYPSRRIVHFSELEPREENAASIGLSWLRERGIYAYSDAYSLCSEVLDFCDRYGTVTDVAMKKYTESFGRIISRIGISALYEVAL